MSLYLPILYVELLHSSLLLQHVEDKFAFHRISYKLLLADVSVTFLVHGISVNNSKCKPSVLLLFQPKSPN